MITDAIKDCSTRNGIVLDTFGGSCSTLLAAEQVGRKARMMELDPIYVDTIITRFEAATGQSARLKDSSLRFADVARERQVRSLRQ